MAKKDLDLNNLRKSKDEDELIDTKDPYGVEESWWWMFQNPLGIILALGLLVVLLIGVWLMFQPSSYTPPNASDLIVVKPDKGPYKQIPDPQSNTVVQNQDKEVYKRLGSSKQKEPELTSKVIPKDKEEPVDLNKVNLAKAVVSKEKTQVKPVTEKENIDSVNKATVNIVKVTEGSSLKEPPKHQQTEKLSKLTPVQTLNAGAYVIRVASFKKQVTAERELKRLFSVLGKSLKGVGSSVKKITNKSGTAFYVVKIGGFKTLDQAKKISQTLRSKHFESVIQKVKK